jgi:hypothetical protein
LLVASGVGATLVQVFLAMAMAFPAAADPESNAGRLVLRVYNVYGLSQSDVEIARTTVRGVFKTAGVETTWRDCPGTTNDPCREVLAANEIAVRLIHSPQGRAVTSDDFTLGVSLVHSELGGSYASVFPDRVETIAERFGPDRVLLLGRAIAHEVGHLLLGMSAHAPTGLMRAHWSERPMQASTPGDWNFSSGEARRLREATAGRPVSPASVGHVAPASALTIAAAKIPTEH